MSNYNRVILVGSLVCDAETIRHAQSRFPVTKLRIPVNRRTIGITSFITSTSSRQTNLRSQLTRTRVKECRFEDRPSMHPYKSKSGEQHRPESSCRSCKRLAEEAKKRKVMT